MKETPEDNNCARIAIVGLGNALLKDEGIGVHVTQALRRTIGDDRTDINIIDGGTCPDIFLLLDGMSRLILVDAVHGGSKPGSVYRFQPNHITVPDKCITSLHEIDVLDGLKMMELSGIKPDDITIIGIEPEEIDWGLELSATLSQQLPRIVDIVIDELNGAIDEMADRKG